MSYRAYSKITAVNREIHGLKNSIKYLEFKNAALKRELSELREASANYMDAVMHMRYSEIEKTLPILRALLKK